MGLCSHTLKHPKSHLGIFTLFRTRIKLSCVFKCCENRFSQWKHWTLKCLEVAPISRFGDLPKDTFPSHSAAHLLGDNTKWKVEFYRICFVSTCLIRELLSFLFTLCSAFKVLQNLKTLFFNQRISPSINTPSIGFLCRETLKLGTKFL